MKMNATRQASLFDDAPAITTKIAGLIYIPNFITPEQETSLIQTVDAQPWMSDLKRRVQHYGWKYDYKARGISNDLRLGDLPDWLAGYAKRLYTGGYFPHVPDQIIVNEYLPSQGITPHIDCIPCFGNVIASLSLGSACMMEFSKAQEKIPVLLEARSLVVLTGDARYQWKHAIPQRKTDSFSGQKIMRSRRLSLTFREVRLLDS